MTEKHYTSPRWTGELADCSMPLTFDQYSNCSYGCLYCFSQFQRGVCLTKGSYLAGPAAARSVDVEKVKRTFTVPGSSEYWPYISKRLVMQWGGLSDPFCFLEQRRGVGLELLRFFREIDYPICFSTKGTWWTEDARYVDLFRGNKNWNVKVSIITLDTEKARVIERGCPSPDERLRAIERIASWGGGGVTLRLRPFMIGISNPSHVPLITMAGRAGAGAVSTEFFCVETRSPTLKEKMPEMSRLAGIDLDALYRSHSVSSGYRRLNRNVKRKFVDEMEAAARAVGMRFYVSDAHFKERCDNGSCCGLTPDWNYSRGQFTEALVLCRKNGRVTWGEIAPGLEHFRHVHAVNSPSCQIARSSSERRAQFNPLSMFELVRWFWNNPSSGQSPYRMFEGIMKPVGVDGEKNVIYEYDSSRG